MENNAGMQLSPSCQPEPNTVWFGLALLYYDTRFPRFSRLLPQHDIWRFSTDYLFKFAGRFFNWRFIVASAVFLVYRWLAKRVRLTADTETPPLFLKDELSKLYDNEAKHHISFA